MLRCPECRSRRTTYKSMQLHIKASGHKLCTCGGYHALRADEPDEVLLDILVDMAWNLPGKPLSKYNINLL